jgi:excisionase family DNA binding protein
VAVRKGLSIVNASVPAFVGYGEACKLLGLPRGTLRRLVHEGRLPHLRFGPRTVRFDVALLRRFAEDHTFIPTKEAIMADEKTEQPLEGIPNALDAHSASFRAGWDAAMAEAVRRNVCTPTHGHAVRSLEGADNEQQELSSAPEEEAETPK